MISLGFPVDVARFRGKRGGCSQHSAQISKYREHRQSHVETRPNAGDALQDIPAVVMRIA
jgi:hypothetical protein